MKRKIFRLNLNSELSIETEGNYFWHGTSGTHPEKIYHGEEGFDVIFSQKGMWGKGLYFAKKAEYSDPYSYRFPDGSRGMFFA